MGHRKDRGEVDRRKILTIAVVHRQRVQPVAGLHRMGLVLLQVADQVRLVTELLNARHHVD